MFQSDYILRVIEQLGVLVRRMFDALREARPDEALRLSEEALGLALGLDPNVALALTGEGLLSFMGAGGEIDPAYALAVGEVLAVRALAAERVGDAARHEAEGARSRVVLEAVRVHGDEGQAERAWQLLGMLRSDM